MKVQILLKKEILSMKKALAAYFLVSLGTLLLQLLVPYVSGSYIDSLVGKQPMILAFVGAMAFLNIFSILMEYGMTYLMTKLNNTFLYKICNKMFQHVYGTSLSFFQSHDAAFLTDQITGDAATIAEFVLNSIPDIAYNMLLLIVSALFVLRADLILGLLVMLTIPIYLYIYWKLEKRMYENEHEYKEAGNDYTSKGMEQIRCTQFVKENAISKEMEDRFACSFHRMLKSAVGQVKTQYLFSNLNRLIMVLCYLLILGIGGYNVVIGKISIGYFTIINSYVNMILSAASDIIDFSGSYPKVKVAADRMNELLAECQTETLCNKRLRNLEENEIKTVRLENISFSFGKKMLFHQLSATFEVGKIYGIVGENGAGKSTLLDVILGLYPKEYGGEILYNGTNIKELCSSEILKCNIAFLGQQTERINISPKEYLHFGIEKYNPDIEQELIRQFLLNQDFDMEQEENIVHCSGGEMQKLALVRTFQKNCTLTILDEPTNGLDMETVQRLVQLLIQEKEHHIFIIVSHDKRILDICDEKIDLNILGM
ncbi:ABC transporter ATP-binding protein [Lachnospiraceae bacterium KK002]